MTDPAAVEAARMEAMGHFEVTLPGEHMTGEEAHAFTAGWEEACAYFDAALKEKEECAANASAKDTTEQDVSDGGSDTAVIADLRARLAAAEEERDAHWRELVRINEERNRFRDERDALTAERDRLKEQLLRVGKGRNDAERERDALKAAVDQARESARRQVESVLMLHYGAVHACAVEDLVEILGGNST